MMYTIYIIDKEQIARLKKLLTGMALKLINFKFTFLKINIIMFNYFFNSLSF